MKARLSYDHMPPSAQKDIDRIVNRYIAMYRDAVIDRYICGMLLMLSDCFGFGITRISRAMSGFIEIVHGYADDCYDGVDKKLQKMETMNQAMHDELASRGIIVTQDHGSFNVSVREGGGRNRETK